MRFIVGQQSIDLDLVEQNLTAAQLSALIRETTTNVTRRVHTLINSTARSARPSHHGVYHRMGHRAICTTTQSPDDSAQDAIALRSWPWRYFERFQRRTFLCAECIPQLTAAAFGPWLFDIAYPLRLQHVSDVSLQWY